jgi:hypothetical protein
MIRPSYLKKLSYRKNLNRISAKYIAGLLEDVPFVMQVGMYIQHDRAPPRFPCGDTTRK